MHAQGMALSEFNGRQFTHQLCSPVSLQLLGFKISH